MNRRFAALSLALCLSLCLSLATSAMAQTSTATPSALPRLLRFGGVVKDLNGNPLTGVVGVTFALYGEQTGGAALWLETQNVTADSHGHFTALLGASKPDGLPPELFTSVEARWVGVQVSGQAEQARVLLVSAPYAFKAGDAETIGGLPPSAFVLANPGQGAPGVQNTAGSVSTRANASSITAPTNPDVTGAGTTGYVPLWDASSDIVNSMLFQTGSGSSAKMGISTTAPADTLDVNGTVNAANGFYVGNRQFAFGVYNKGNAFLGFSGNPTGGSDNTAVGVNALLTEVSGQGNTGTGWNALSTNNGNHNTAAGDDALHLNRSGNSNSGFGFAALASNNGSFNSALGSNAGTDQTTPSLTYATAIGAYADVTTSNSMVLGSIAGTNGCISPACTNTNVGIGTTAPSFSLDVHGNANFTGPVTFESSQAFPNTISGVTTANNSGLVGGGTTGKLNLSLINTCSVGQILLWNGSDSGGWMCFSPITGVTTNRGLTGGGLAGTVTIGIDPNVVAELGLENNFTASQSVSGSLSATYLFSSAGVTAGGGAILPATGNSQTSGSPSSPLDLTASASNGTSSSYQTFRWQTLNVDGTTPSADLNLLFGSGGATPQPTGLSVAPNGIISFAPNQTFPGGGGGGVITTVAAGTGLSGGGSTPTVTLNVNQSVVAFQSDLTNGINTAETFATTAANTAQTAAENYANSTFVPLTAEGAFATLGANTFTGNQTVNGNLNLAAPGSTFQIGSIPFAFGAFGTQNAFLGFAGNSTMTGLYNTASGYQALLANTIGNGNTGNGDLALTNNTSGSQNTASGGAALANNTIGSYNTANGDQALLFNTIGVANTASGFEALDFNTAGSGNTALGYEAGNPTNSVNTTGSNNTFVGSTANSGTQTSLNNATAIGAYAQVTANNALVLGSILGTNGCSAPCGSVNVGIGTTAPTYPLDVNGVIRSSTGGFMFPDGTVQITKASGGGSGTVTSVAVTAGGGLAASPNPITSSGTLTIDTSVVPLLATSNTFGGAITAPSFDGNGAGLTNVNAAALGGFSPSTFATLGANSFTGNQTIAGSLSVNEGVSSTEFLTGGSLVAYTDASLGNALFGAAGNVVSLISGGQNTAAGVLALSVGTTGNDNTAIGNQALLQNTTGSNNTAIGALAGVTADGQPLTGNNNTAVGTGTAFGLDSIANATAVGSNAYVTKNNALVLGGILGSGTCTTQNNCASVNVGIGTTAPQATLDVEAPSLSPPPTVNFGSASIPAAFTVNGTTTVNGPTTIAGNLNVSGTITCASGCGGGGGSGTVTSVATGLGLSGGPITSSGTLSINTSVVPQLGGANTFTGTNNFTGTTTAASILATNLTTSGAISGGNIYGTALYLNGNSSNPFAYTSGSGGGDNAFLGFSGEFTNKSSPGDFNTAVGFGALNNNGGCCGPNAASNNTATGSSALLSNTTGASNTASGFDALYNNTTGSNNTAMGYNAGSPTVYEDTTGSNNTFLGASSSPGTQSALSNATAIGANAVVGQSNALVLGSIINMNGCTSPCMSTSVGIGTATPGATLDVQAPSGTPAPSVNFGSTSNPAAFTVNGTTTITGNLNINGTCTGCGGGGGGGGTITGVTAGTGLTGGGTSGNVTLNLNTAAMNTFTGTQMFNVPTGNGIVASTSGNSNAGISGSNNSALGTGAGVAGFSVSGSGSGVVGTNSSASLGGGYGVQGLSYNTADPGVGGINNSPNGSAYGVWGQSLSSTGTGVYGSGIATGVTGSATGSGTGVYGTGGNIGVTGSAPGTGVFGLATATTGTGSGVLGQSNSPGGTGVTGLNSSAGGNGVSGLGFTGVNGAGAGSGVTGTSTSSTGSGVVGIENSGGGYAGFFQGDVAITGNAAVSGNTTMTGNTTVGGNLAIGGDTPMSHSPRMTFSGSVASFATSPQAAGFFIPDQAIVITRLTVAVGYGQTPLLCHSNESMSLTINGNANAAKVIAPVGGFFYDSGALNIPVNAGTPIYMYGNSASGDPGCQSGNNINATVEYVMQ